jgi:hypothetical protein
MPTSVSSDLEGVINDYLKNVTKSRSNVAVVIGYLQWESSSNDTLVGGVVCSEPKIMDRLGNTNVTVGELTPFEIASVSKVFTTDIFNQAHGLSQVLPPWNEQPLKAYLPALSSSLSPDMQGLDVNYIAAYSSGLPEDNGDCSKATGYPDYVASSMDGLLCHLASYNPGTSPQHAWPPGAYMTYSNLGMSLLAMAALGTSDSNDTGDFSYNYSNSVVDYCNLTLGLQIDPSAPTTANFNIYESINPSQGNPTGVLPIGLEGDTYQWTFADPVFLPESGSGGLVSCGGDMLAFLSYAMRWDGYPDFMQQIKFPNQVSVCDGSTWNNGFGWFLTDNMFIGYDQGKSQTVPTMVWKDGGVVGFSSWIGFLPKNSTSNNGGPTNSPAGLFVLTNTDDAWTIALNWTGELTGPSAFQCIAPSSEVSVDQKPAVLPKRTRNPHVHR